MDKQNHEPKKDYDPWENYETFAAFTWLKNINEVYEILIDMADDSDVEELANFIRMWIEESIPLLVKGLYRDLLDRAIGKINYMQIAKAYKGEA